MATSLSDYTAFLNGLLGTIDDAEHAGFDEDGIAQLLEAYEFFGSDLRMRRLSETEAEVRETVVRSKIDEGS